LLDDAVHDGQAKTAAAGKILGCEEGLEGVREDIGDIPQPESKMRRTA
jgi:hypothetical protein